MGDEAAIERIKAILREAKPKTPEITWHEIAQMRSYLKAARAALRLVERRVDRIERRAVG
jgi:uncharacterized protein with HEPN domain